MSLTYTTTVSLFFTITPEHTDAFMRSWNKFENLVTVVAGLTHSHFHTVVKSTASPVTGPTGQNFQETTATPVWLALHGVPVECSRISTHTTHNSLGCWSNTWEVTTNSAIIRKWKWLIINDCKIKSLISTATEFLNSCQNGPNPPACSWITIKHVMSLK